MRLRPSWHPRHDKQVTQRAERESLDLFIIFHFQLLDQYQVFFKQGHYIYLIAS
jgi:hypothetical protein